MPTLWALHELMMFLGYVRRDLRHCLFARNRHQSFIAVRTAIAALITHTEIDLKVPVELAELAFHVIARDQCVAAAEDSSLGQVSIAREQPPILPKRTRDQRLIFNDLFVGGVVAEDTQPAGQAAEHRINHEADGRVTGLFPYAHKQKVETRLYLRAITVWPEPDSIDDQLLTFHSDLSAQKEFRQPGTGHHMISDSWNDEPAFACR